MKRYTFLLGNSKDGLELRLSVSAHDTADAVKLGRAQLFEQLDSDNKLPIQMQWGLKGQLDINLNAINEDSLVSIEPIKDHPAIQLNLDMADPRELQPDEELNHVLFVPGGMSYVPLSTSSIH